MKKNMDKRKKGLVLLSGGLDSTVTLSICRKSNIEIHAMTFDYGQRHKKLNLILQNGRPKNSTVNLIRYLKLICMGLKP